MKENVQMTKKPRHLFTDEQKAEAVNIVKQSGKPVSQVAKAMERDFLKKKQRSSLPGKAPTLRANPCREGAFPNRFDVSCIESDSQWLLRLAGASRLPPSKGVSDVV
jgi:hypothetical protein